MITARRALIVVAAALIGLTVAGIVPRGAPEPPNHRFLKVMVGGEVFVVDAKLFGLFLGDRISLAREAEKHAVDEAQAAFTAEIVGITQGMMPGVDLFEQWYHGWYTQYALLSIAARAYASTDGASQMSPRAAAENAVRDEFVRRFVEIVVRPEVNDKLVTEAAERAIDRIDHGYAATMAETRRLVSDFVHTAALPDKKADDAPVFAFDDSVSGVVRIGTGGVGLPEVGRDAAAGVDLDVVTWIAGLNTNGVLWQIAETSVAWIATIVITPIVTVAMANIGLAITAGAVGVGAGPLAALAVPTLFAVGLGIATVTDISIDNLTSTMQKDEFVASAKAAVVTMRGKLVDSFRPTLTSHADRLYGGFAGRLEKVRVMAPVASTKPD